MKSKPKATARPVIEAVSQRLGVDTDLLMHLFEECLNEVISYAESKGACTIRGLGKFTQVKVDAHLMEKGKNNAAPELKTIFERAKYVPVNRPFQALKLRKQLFDSPAQQPETN